MGISHYQRRTGEGRGGGGGEGLLFISFLFFSLSSSSFFVMGRRRPPSSSFILPLFLSSLLFLCNKGGQGLSAWDRSCNEGEISAGGCEIIPDWSPIADSIVTDDYYYNTWSK